MCSKDVFFNRFDPSTSTNLIHMVMKKKTIITNLSTHHTIRIPHSVRDSQREGGDSHSERQCQTQRVSQGEGVSDHGRKHQKKHRAAKMRS